MEKQKEHCVYSHSYNNKLFYIGSGRIYTKEEKSTSRPYDFINRSEDWYNFCERNTDQVKVEILFETNDRKESQAIEEHITGMYIDRVPLVNKNIGTRMGEEQKRNLSEALKGRTLSEEHRRNLSKAAKSKKNYMCGKKLNEETRDKISLALKGENHPMWGKKHSTETRKKISLATSGENNPKAKKVLITNNQTQDTKDFGTIQDAYKFISQNGFDKTRHTLQNYLRKGAFQFNNYTLEIIKEFNQGA